tara:strand:- start:82 stop:303 length:222 start_codon:yes stop_codon:yes gene_type:complete
MKATLEFGDEERNELLNALHAQDMAVILNTYDQMLRNLIKHEGHKLTTATEAFEYAREELNTLVSGYGIEIGT